MQARYIKHGSFPASIVSTGLEAFAGQIPAAFITPGASNYFTLVTAFVINSLPAIGCTMLLDKQGG